MILGLILVPAAAQADCQGNIYWTPPVEYHSNFGTTGAYDLVAGTGFASWAGGIGEQPAEAAMLVRDIYQIVGPPSVIPIPLVVRMHVTGMATGGFWTFSTGTRCVTSDVRMVLNSSGQAAVAEIHASCNTPSVTFDDDLEIQIAHIPGENFLIEYWNEIDTNPGTAARGDWVVAFVLPNGYSMASCQGYGGANPVPAHTSSWGRIRQSYR